MNLYLLLLPKRTQFRICRIKGEPIGDKMREYEITSIIVEGQASVIDETKQTIKDILKKNSAEVTTEEDWGSKKLWYLIDGHETGHFSFLKCKAEPKSIEKIEHEFYLNQNILKTSIIKI